MNIRVEIYTVGNPRPVCTWTDPANARKALLDGVLQGKLVRLMRSESVPVRRCQPHAKR